MVNDIKTEIDNLQEETTHFDFPFFTNLEKKKNILNCKRTYVECKLKAISGDKYPNQNFIDEEWEKAVKYADEQFKSLPEDIRINGFYLQELMHYYVEQLGTVILSEN